MRLRTATTLRGKLSLGSLRRPLGPRNHGSWSPGRCGACGPSLSAKSAQATRLSEGNGSTTTRATRTVPMSAADTSRKT
eukprot:5068444-Alexandrium_andersonii.AAC.1